MNDRPDAAELLDIARRTLLGDILPRLPQELRYGTLMIANAMAIAGREHATAGSDAEAEIESLGRLFAESPPPLAGTGLHATLDAYNRRLAAAIRAGRFDDRERAALLGHLRQTAAARLAVTNPKALADQ